MLNQNNGVYKEDKVGKYFQTILWDGIINANWNDRME